MPITYQYETLATLRERAKEEVGKVVVGQGRAVELLLIAAMLSTYVPWPVRRDASSRRLTAEPT